MRITESQLGKIIREELLRESSFHREKLKLVRDALSTLYQAQALVEENRHDDFDLDNLVEKLELYSESVMVMADNESDSRRGSPWA